MLLACGMTLLNVTMLVPAWLQCRQLNWQRQVMRLQVERLEQQDQRYQQFQQALEEDDPVLLERLAFSHLRLKPTGCETLTLAAAPFDSGAAYLIQYDRPPTLDNGFGDLPDQTIDGGLHHPLPRPGVDYRPWHPVRSRLVHITTGPLRLGLAAVGGICLLGGFAPPPANR